jgi:hypothetical protein
MWIPSIARVSIVMRPSENEAVTSGKVAGTATFHTDGEFVSLQEHVSHPNRIALDADGTGIEIWKRDGTKIGSWGEKGEAPGQCVAGSVYGAWMDTDDSLYTAEASRNNRLQKFVCV